MSIASKVIGLLKGVFGLSKISSGLKSDNALLLPDGSQSNPALSFSTETGSGLVRAAAFHYVYYINQASVLDIQQGQLILQNAGGALFWLNSDTGRLAFGGSQDLILARDAPNTLAQRNGANAQKQRWYNFYTDASNGSWGFVDAGVTSAGALTIGVTGNGTGASSLTQIILAGVVKFDAHFGAITADTDGSTVTFDMSVSDKHAVTLGGNRTLATSNDQTGQVILVVLKQDGTGSRTVTWWAGIRWAGGAAPTLTTTAGKEDAFSFVKRGAGDYMGFVMGQNL